MMKYIRTISVMLNLIAFIAHGQGSTDNTNLRTSQTNFYTLDSMVFHKWDDTQDQWILYSGTKFKYNDNGKILDSYVYTFEQNTWTLSSQLKYEYNTEGILKNVFEYRLDATNSLKNWEKKEYSVNTYNQVIETILYRSDGNKWENYWKTNFQYDNNGNLTLESEQRWSNTDQKWDPTSKYTIKYDADKFLLREDFFWDTANNLWKKKTTTEYEYDDKSYKEITYTYDESIKDYIEQGKLELLYDDYGNPYEKTTHFNRNNFMLPGNKYFYSYDISVDKSYVKIPETDFFNMHYSMLKNGLPSIEINNKPKDLTIQMRGIRYTKFTNYEQYKFYYSAEEITAVDDMQLKPSVVFPNPATDYTSFKNPEGTVSAGFELYNVQGQKVISGILEEQTQKIDLSGLKPGVYFYHLNKGNNVLRGKLIKE